MSKDEPPYPRLAQKQKSLFQISILSPFATPSFQKSLHTPEAGNRALSLPSLLAKSISLLLLVFSKAVSPDYKYFRLGQGVEHSPETTG